MRDKVVRQLGKTPVVGIYMVTNMVNSKIYIGQSIDIDRRWNQHRYGKGSIILRNAINKYGIDNFNFEVVEKVDVEGLSDGEAKELLTSVEQKWLDNEKPYLKENGYNQQSVAKPNILIKRPEDYGKLISKIKIDNNHCGKGVIQYNLDGELIKEWKSAAQIERVLGYHAENISGCCIKKQKSSNGFIWGFKGTMITTEVINDANKSKRLSTVRRYDLNGIQIDTFENTKDASEKTGLSWSAIRQACSGHRKTGCGYIWKFKNQPLILSEHKRGG
mgnify:CR=1 FL=1|tara:strand:- start:18986 stop:19810 length:825 start_codon:yes stop_codon:yes gene_type:complete